METQFDWLTALSNVGFPIVLVFYLLTRLEKSFQRLEEVIENLIGEIQKK
ncbi:YvrJ family protein [Priestia flexa]|nr:MULTISPECIES: YvrJ family protein [Bacillaceae]SCC59714.1 YvrJ protein family protein [Priestia flexa]